MSKIVRFIFPLVSIGLTFLIFWKIDLFSYLSGQHHMWDFDVYYRIAQDVWSGLHPYQLDYMQTSGPPSVIIPYLLFIPANLEVARSIMTFISTLSVLITSFVITRYIFSVRSISWAIVLNLFFWMTFLVRYNIILGQPNLFLMMLVSLALAQSNQMIKSFFVSTQILVKTNYLLVLLSFITKNQIKFWVSTILIGFAVFFLCLPIIKPVYYYDFATLRLNHYVGDAPKIPDLDYYNQSLKVMTARLNITPAYPFIYLVLILTCLYSIVLTKDYSLGILASLILSPILWQHYFVVIYPVAIYHLIDTIKKKKIPFTGIAGFILIIIHLPWLHNHEISIVPGIMASHYLLGSILIFYERLRFLLHNQTESKFFHTASAP